jgi:hypothetical protein
MVTVEVNEVPEHPPDHPAKVELEPGVAVSVTTVPALKVVPVGLLVTVPEPVPPLVMLRVYWATPDWVAVKVCPAIVNVPVLDEALGLANTE